MASTTKRWKTARQTYDQRRNEIDEKMSTISALLDTHKSRMFGNPGDWGFAGDLAKVNILLREVRETLGYTTA